MNRWLSRRVHASWHIAWLCLGIIVGVALCLMTADKFIDNSWLVIGLALFFIALVRRFRVMLVVALLAGLLIGLWRGSVMQNALDEYKPYYKQSVGLKGKVVQDTSYGPRGDQRLRLGYVQIDDQPLSGEVWISMSKTNTEIKRGDSVTLKGVLGEGFGNLPATMYRAEVVQIERAQPGDIARQFRDWFAGGVHRSIPEPQSSLGLGYLVGQRSALPETLEQQVRIVGLTHVVVASGYNLMILVAFARHIFARISKYLAVLTGGSMIAGFMLITGLSPSMSRAGLVSGLGLLAWYYGRKIHPLVLLPFAAAITVLIRPSYIWGDIGWYLSFAAFTGIIMLAPLLRHFFWGMDKKAHVLRRLFVETSSAQIATLPIILFAFGQYSVFALPANLLVLPLVPFAMLFTFAAGFSGLIVPGFATWVGLPATAILTYSTKVIEWISGLPGAQGEIVFSMSMLIISYLFLVFLMLLLWYKTKHDFRQDDTLI